MGRKCQYKLLHAAASYWIQRHFIYIMNVASETDSSEVGLLWQIGLVGAGQAGKIAG